jgi:hypothetical protein
MKLIFLLLSGLCINGICAQDNGTNPSTINSSQLKLKDIDSSCFSIFIASDHYQARIQNKITKVKTKSELDEFIRTNKTLIDPKKVYVIGNADIKYERFKPVIELIKKYEFYGFKMIVL